MNTNFNNPYLVRKSKDSLAVWATTVIEDRGVRSRQTFEKTLINDFDHIIRKREFGRPTVTKEGIPDVTPIRLFDYRPL